MGRGKKRNARRRSRFVALHSLSNNGNHDIGTLVDRAKQRAPADTQLTREKEREGAEKETAELTDGISELFLPRIPFGTSCTQIVRAVVRQLRQCHAEPADSPWDDAAIETPHILSNCPVVRCEIKRAGGRGRAYSTLSIQTKHLADLLTNSGALPIRGFLVSVRISKYPSIPGIGNAWRTRPDPGSSRWKVNIVQVGRRLDECTFATFWESSLSTDISEDCIVEINPVTHVVAIVIGRMQNVLRAGDDLLSFSSASAMLRLELPFRDIVDASFAEPMKGSNGKFAGYISLSRPPRIFRSQTPAFDLTAQTRDSYPMMWNHKEGYLQEVRWVRTVDPTRNSSFSRAMWIRLTMSSREFTSFFKQLHRWCLTNSPDPVMLSSRTLRDVGNVDLTYLFGPAKKLNISFELRYSAACVFSFGTVDLKSVSTAFWNVIAEEMDEDDSRLVLRAMYEDCSHNQTVRSDIDALILLRQCMERCNVGTKECKEGKGDAEKNELSSDFFGSDSSYSSISEATEDNDLDEFLRGLTLEGRPSRGGIPSASANSGNDSAMPSSDRKPSQLTLVRRLVYTPTRCIALPAEEDLLNRVLRAFADYRDRFIRVSFTDEDLGSLAYAGSPDLLARVRIALRDGVQSAGERFVFLAFSNSQLRDHGVWMYNEAPSPSVQPPSADEIRQWMGDFSHIRVPAKYAARLGQAFSSTVGTVVIDEGHQTMIEDVLDSSGRYVFSDGVGTISFELAEQVARRLRLQHVPSVFQVRFGGAKGVLTVWDKALTRGIDVALRPSMKKFESEHRRLEIVGFSKRLPIYLNRQVITTLSALGVPDEVFEWKQERFLRQLNQAMHADGAFDALNLLYTAGHNDSGVKLRASSPMMDTARFFQAGLTCASCEHLFNMMNAFRRRVIKDLLFKARIPIDSDKGVCLYGVMDELGVLAEEEVFCQYIEPRSGQRIIVTGTVLVGRSPCLHPGDIQILKARDHLSLRHLQDVIVFPRRGMRPIPSKLSGGDLDGDIYFCIFDNDICDSVRKESFRAMDYTAPDVVSLSRDVMTDDIASFFVDYIKNDTLGRIANAHIAYSDKEKTGAESQACMRLAQLHSVAVDFAKTGVPAVFPRDLILSNVPEQFPDFLGKHSSVSYRSDKALGKMYRACSVGKRDSLLSRPFTANPKSHEIDEIIDGIPTGSDTLRDAEMLCKAYNYDLERIMEEFGVRTEGEVISGEVFSFTERHAELRARKDYDLRIRLNRRASELRNSYRHQFYEGIARQQRSELTEHTIVRACAWHKACRKVAAQDRARAVGVTGMVSFPWVVSDVLLQIIQHQLEDCEK